MPVILDATYTLTGGEPMPAVTALRGANSIEAITTSSLVFNDVILVVIDGVLSGWQYLPGGADSSDPQNQVAPLDNPGNHWQRVGGFGATFLAGVRLTTTASVSLAHGVSTAITFDTARFNSGEWSVSSNPTRFTCTVPGIYALSGSASFAANATGQRTLALRLNGATTIASQNTSGNAAVAANVSVATFYQLDTNDYVELVATQTSGSALDVLKANEYSPEFSALWAGASTVLGTVHEPSDTEPHPSVGNTVTDFTINDVGWYRVFVGAVPSGGSFRLQRADQGDLAPGDFVIDWSIIGSSPEGTINLSRNVVPTPSAPPLDSVRVSHTSTEGYVDVHLIRAGGWTLTYSANDQDQGYVDAPYLVSAAGTSASLEFKATPNVIGGTVKIEAPQFNDSSGKLIAHASTTWAAATGVAARTSFETTTATLTQVAERLKAIIDDLIAQGVFLAGLPSSMTYSDMLALADAIVSEGSVANITNIFRVSVAPDTTVQGIYTPVGTFNGHTNYKIQGYEWDTSNAYACRWSTEWSTWTILNASGNLYHSGAAETNPWEVVQWKDQASANVSVTTVAPNIAFTYNALTDTHTAQIISGSSTGFNGLYLRGADLNSKRRYYAVGSGSNNKRIEWTGTAWNIKDDSVTYATSTEAVTYPDEVVSWTVTPSTDVIVVTGINAVDLMSGLTVGGATYNGIYAPVQGVYNSLGGRKLIYRRTDGAYYIQNSGVSWSIHASLGGSTVVSDTDGNFPWNASWLTAELTMQQNAIAAPGWVNGVSQGNITGNVTGNWHI